MNNLKPAIYLLAVFIVWFHFGIAQSVDQIDKSVMEIRNDRDQFTTEVVDFSPHADIIRTVFRGGKEVKYVLQTGTQFEWRVDTLEYFFSDGNLIHVNDKRINKTNGELELHDRIYLDGKRMLLWVKSDGTEVSENNCKELGLEVEFKQREEQYLEISKSWK
ncbi:MAG: hypothetical protein R2813_01685 [Flavobacteriales bacterium]